MGNKAEKNLFTEHESARAKAERATADYNRSIADIGGKVSTDKGGKTEKQRDAHTKRSK